MGTDIQLFKLAGLATQDLAKYKKALLKTQATAPVIGGLPILKLGKDGVWRYGQTDTEVQEGAEWAINPTTFQKGFIAWAKEGGTKPLGKQMQPILLGDLPVREELPDVGADWSENIYFELTCLNGDDEGKTVQFTNSAMGAVEAFHTLVAHLIHQIETEPGKLVPIITLEHSGYQHSNRSYGIKGWVVKPVFEIVEWMDNDASPEAVGEEDEPDEPEKETVAPKRGPAPKRGGAEAKPEPEPTKTVARGARGTATPRGAAPARDKAPARGAAPSRRNGAAKKADAAPEDSEPEVETVEPVVRRRRRQAVDVE